jgi:hypothetical protein
VIGELDRRGAGPRAGWLHSLSRARARQAYGCQYVRAAGVVDAHSVTHHVYMPMRVCICVYMFTVYIYTHIQRHVA